MPHVPRMPHTRRWPHPVWRESVAAPAGRSASFACRAPGGGCAGCGCGRHAGLVAVPGVAEVGGRPPLRVGPQALSGACLAVVWPWPARRSRWPCPAWWNRTARCSGPGRVLGVRRSGRGARCRRVHVGIGGGTWRGGGRWQRSAGRAAGIPHATPGAGSRSRWGNSRAAGFSRPCIRRSTRRVGPTPGGLASQFVGQAVHRLGRARQVQDEQRDAEGVGAGAGLGGVAGQ